MLEPVINEDELIGYIMRKTSFSHSLTYDEIRSVLDAEIEFLQEKGIAKSYTAER